MFGTSSLVLHEVIVGSAATTVEALRALSQEDLVKALPELTLIAGAMQEVGPSPSKTSSPAELRESLTLRITSSTEPEAWSRVRATALRKNAERFRTGPLTPHIPFPNEDLYTQTIPYLIALKSYVMARDKDGMTLLERKWAKVVAVSEKIERAMIQSFGSDKEDWPKNLRQSIEELYNIGHNIWDKKGVATDSFMEALKEMEIPSPDGKVRAIAIRGIFAVKGIFGQLTEDQEALIAKRAKLQEKPLLQRWRTQSERIRKLYEETKGTFELTAELLAKLNEAREKQIPLWREEAMTLMLAAEELKERVPKNEWTEDMEHLSTLVSEEVIRSLEAGDQFIAAHTALLTEKILENPDAQKLKIHYTEASHAKDKMGRTLGKARRALLGHTVTGEKESNTRDPHNLTDLVSGRHEIAQKTYPVPDRDFEYRGHRIAVKEGHVLIDNTPVDLVLNTSPAGQNDKIRQIIDTLLLSPDEEARSTQIANPFYQWEVAGRISKGQPLRVLVDVEEELGVVKVYDYRFGTVFYIPYHMGWFASGALAIMPLLHGGGGARSRGETLLTPANRLRKDLHISPLFFDLPNHGGSFKSERFHEIGFMMTWLDSIFAYCRYLSGDRIPLVALGRSFGENLLDEYATRSPQTLDAIIGISGYQPGWLEANKESFQRRIESGDFQPHPTGLPMVFAHERQWTFANKESYASRQKTPKLTFTGTEDQDTKEGVPDFYRQRDEIAKQLGHQSIVIQGGQHDLLALNFQSDPSPENKDRIDTVYAAIGKFVREVAGKFKPPV